MKLVSLRDRTELEVIFLDSIGLTGARKITSEYTVDDQNKMLKALYPYIRQNENKRNKILSGFLTKFELGEIKPNTKYLFEDGISIEIKKVLYFEPEVPAPPSLLQRFWFKKTKPEEIKKENIKTPCSSQFESTKSHKLYLIQSTPFNVDLPKLKEKDFKKQIDGVSKDWIWTKQVGSIGKSMPGIPVSGYVIVQNEKTGTVLSILFKPEIKNEKELQDLIKKAIEEYELDKSTGKLDKTKRK
jgi:hypothetical protein